MLELTKILDAQHAPDDSLTLPFAARQTSRQRVRLDSGAAAGVLLPPGTRMRPGDLLGSAQGQCVRVCAALEAVSSGYSADPLLLARASYHLGNRHVAVQIGAGWVRYLHDHVLDAMLAGLGLPIQSEQLPFEPEAGAYGAHSHAGTHGHAH